MSPTRTLPFLSVSPEAVKNCRATLQYDLGSLILFFLSVSPEAVKSNVAILFNLVAVQDLCNLLLSFLPSLSPKAVKSEK